MSSFWNPEKCDSELSRYCWADELNEEIWSTSAQVQRLIQGPEELAKEGCFGAQQGMVDGQTVLPWPPDLLGRDWAKPGGLLIIGSAYAGFIREFSGRGASMFLSDYDPKLSWQEFQKRFLRDVVVNDPKYYGGLAALLTGVLPVSSIATFDLCRASFVKRRRMVYGTGDDQGDGIVRAGKSVFRRYVEDPTRPGPADWIWRRIVASKASAIVVLGSIAEHGFLRFAQRRGLAIEVVGEEELKVFTELDLGNWVGDYALNPRRIESTSNPGIAGEFDRLKMKYWLENGGRWYSLSGWVDGIERCVLPVYHPSRVSRYYPRYESTIPVLKRMLAACSPIRPPAATA